MIKILFFINDLKYGGAEKVLVNLVNNLDKYKYDITVLTLFDEGINRKYLNNTIEYRYIFKRVFRANSYLLKVFTPRFLYKRMIKDEYDVFISFLEGASARILSASANQKAVKISWQHSYVGSKRKLSFPVFRSFKEAVEVYKSFDAIVGVSKDVLHSFSEVSGITENLYTLYNANDTELILRKSREVADIEFDKNKINIISIGRLTKVKGYDRLLSIINKMVKRNIINSKFHLYILGQGEEEQKLQNIINRNNLSKFVTMLGFKNNPYKYLRQADLLVCSSYSEGFSTVVTEALILGVPVITTDCSGMMELLGENNEFGIIRKNDEQDLYNGLVELISNKSLLDYYKQKAGERGKKFSINESIKEFDTFVKKMRERVQ